MNFYTYRDCLLLCYC